MPGVGAQLVHRRLVERRSRPPRCPWWRARPTGAEPRTSSPRRSWDGQLARQPGADQRTGVDGHEAAPPGSGGPTSADSAGHLGHAVAVAGDGQSVQGGGVGRQGDRHRRRRRHRRHEPVEGVETAEGLGAGTRPSATGRGRGQAERDDQGEPQGSLVEDGIVVDEVGDELGAHPTRDESLSVTLTG